MRHFYLHHKADLIRIGGTALALLVSLSGKWKTLTSVDVVAIAATLIGGFPMFKEAFEAIRKRRMTMELSMSIAVLATLVVGQYMTGLVITLFVLVAELLEHLTVDRGRGVLRKLAELLPQSAIVRRDGKEFPVLVHELQPGDNIIVKPGGRIPVDGKVTKGNSFVDQSAITGESIPVEKIPGMEVLAGTVNQAGVLEINATGIGRDSTFGRIIDVIEAAQQTQAPIEKTADRLAARLVYFAFAGALATFFITHNMTATISALIVAGACGVAAGTPLAILAGIGRTAREGIIVKGGVYLEQLASADTVVLDKTGTLTLGQPVVTDIRCFNGISRTTVLQLLVTAEQHAEHPLASAILQQAKKEAVDPGPYETIEYLPGRGLRCRINDEDYLIGNLSLLDEKGIGYSAALPWICEQKGKGNTMIVLSSSHQLLGGVGIADVIRPEAREAVSEMRDYHINIVLLSGDHASVVQATGEALAVDQAIGDLLPTDKLEYVRKLKSEGRKVVMVGDGINDAPALIEANVGIAMGAGTDVAFESADMILTTNDLRKVGTAIAISRQCMGVIRFNFWGTIAVDSVGILLALLGYLTPMAAALIHVSSEMFFILNSARLFKKN
ncbi:MAG TPA: cation-translocating P-type ATPase [Puia sp.]|nr:cation-translocating P-type ATPase [Puia sp.]